MNGPEWALGCSECRYGLVGAPPISKTASSVTASRKAQAERGELTFCECKAGQAMRRFLLGDKTPAEKIPTMRIAVDVTGKIHHLPPKPAKAAA